MSKPRPLRRILSDQSKLHANRLHPGSLHALVVRLPFGGESFVIDVPELPEGMTFISAETLAFEPVLHPFDDNLPVFALGHSLYQGQVAGILLGPELHALRAMVGRIQCQPDLSGGPIPPPAEKKLYKSKTIAFENPRPLIAEARFRTESHLHLDPVFIPDLEDRHVWASPQGEGVLVECAHPWPHLVRRVVSEATGLPQRLVTVRSGATYQLKHQRLLQGLIPAALAAIAVQARKEAVLLHWPATDNLRYGFHQAEADFRILTAHDHDGTLVALRVQADLDMGACVLAADEIMGQILMSFLAIYQSVPSEVKINLWAGNSPPRTTGMSFGDNLAQQALEQHMETIARQFGLSPAGFRLEHLRQQARGPGELEFDDTVHLAQLVLAKTVQYSDFSRRHTSYKLQALHRERNLVYHSGIGLALGYQPGNMMDSERLFRPRVSLKYEEDGQLQISAPLEPGNNSVRDSWARIIEKVTGVNERNISFEHLGTDNFLHDPGPLVLGRQYSIVSPLLAQVLEKFNQRENKSGPFEAIAERPLNNVPGWHGSRLEGKPLGRRTWGSAVVELDILSERRTIRVKKVWMTVHAGAQFSESRAKSILEFGIRENIRFCLGRIAYADPLMFGFHWGKLRSVQDELKIFVNILPGESGGPEGTDALEVISGMESMPSLLVPPAFMNALSQALGRSPVTFPPPQLELLREP